MDDIDIGCGPKKPPQKITKLELAERLYFLNRYAGELAMRKNKCSDEAPCDGLGAEIKKLYSLKAAVILKMITDGDAHIRCMQKKGRQRFYVVRVNRSFMFHLPVTANVKRVLNEKNKDKMPELRPEGQGI